MSAHLRPTAPIAADALLPGDPGRALALAQELLVKPKMSNHHRGLWGYSGTTEEGLGLTIQSTGIGGASAAIVLAELARHGVRRAIRIGTCKALEGGPMPGSAVAARTALAVEGPSRAVGAAGPVGPDPGLHSRLLAATAGLASEADVASLDLVSEAPGLAGLAGLAGEQATDGHGVEGPRVVDMGTATLFAVAARIGVAAAGALVVSRAQAAEPVADEELDRAGLELGARAAGALLVG